MTRPTVLGLAALVALSLMAACSRWQGRDRIIVAGFWFEDLTYDVDGFPPDRWGGVLTADERAAIQATAWAEVTAAFDGLRIRVTRDRQAAYRVSVLQDLPRDRHPLVPARRYFGAAGESRAWPGGGRGAVSFSVIAGNALSYTSPTETRDGVVAAIGRGVGRAAAHEFAHQFLPTSNIHASRDVRSYEFASAFRAEQYYGPMRWDIAWPWLVARFGPAGGSHERTIEGSR